MDQTHGGITNEIEKFKQTGSLQNQTIKVKNSKKGRKKIRNSNLKQFENSEQNLHLSINMSCRLENKHKYKHEEEIEIKMQAFTNHCSKKKTPTRLSFRNEDIRENR